MSQVTRDGTSQEASRGPSEAEFDSVGDRVMLVLRTSGMTGGMRRDSKERILELGEQLLKGTGNAASLALTGAGRASGFVFRTVLEAGWGPA